MKGVNSMKAYELLSSKEKWTKKVYATTENGTSCDPRSDEAICFCVLGAIEKCYYVSDSIEDIKIYTDVIAKLKSKVCNIPKWNDAKERTYEEIVEVLKELDI